MVEFVVFMRDVEESFGWDAAYVEASPSESTSLFDADSIETELGRLDGCDIALVDYKLPPGPPPITARS
jgi:hypothetical protein